MKHILKMRNTWHLLGLKKCAKIATILLSLLLSKIGISETITTGNLLPNANDGVDWNSSATDMINDGSSGYVSNGSTVNGFTITCPTGQSNCGYKLK